MLELSNVTSKYRLFLKKQHYIFCIFFLQCKLGTATTSHQPQWVIRVILSINGMQNGKGMTTSKRYILCIRHGKIILQVRQSLISLE